MVDAPSLRTERLVMLPLSANDVDEIAALYRDPEVMRHVTGGVRTRAQSINELDRADRSWSTNGWGPWAVRDATTGALLGEGGIQTPTPIDDAAVDFGMTLGRRCWGRGLGTEAGRAILSDSWDRYSGDRIHAIVLPDNTSSSALMRSLGFNLTGVREIHGEAHQIWTLDRVV